MDRNTLAKRISEMEGKKVQVNIAQIKEVVKCMGEVLKLYGVDINTIIRNAK